MKSIRNRFAHHAEVDDFADSKVLGWISSMVPREVEPLKATTGHGFADRKLTPRELFLTRACTTIVMLSCDLAVVPAAIAERVHPGDVHGRDFAAIPQNLRDARYLAADTLLSIVHPQSSQEPVALPNAEAP